MSIILWNTKVHYTVHKSPPLVSIENQMNSIKAPFYFFKISFILSSYLRLYLPIGLLPLCVLTKTLYALFYSACITCPAHLILLDFIFLIIFAECNKLQINSVSDYYHYYYYYYYYYHYYYYHYYYYHHHDKTRLFITSE
jgi:hypothetical protein